MMLLNRCVVAGTLLNAEKSVGGHVKKSVTSSFFNRIKFCLAVRCRKFSVNKSIKLQFKIPKGC